MIFFFPLLFPRQPRFDWVRALFREHDTLLEIALGGWGLTGLSLGLIQGYTAPGVWTAWYVFPAAATAAWLITKKIKRSRQAAGIL